MTQSDIPGTIGSVRIERTKKKTIAAVQTDEHDAPAPLQLQEGTPKSDASTDRTIR